MIRRKWMALFVLVLIFAWFGISSGSITMKPLLPKDIPDGWALVDGPHLYSRKTLFQRINGQVELFFKYGFQKSIFATYQKLNHPGNQIELDIYDMGNVLQAFGIFSRFRNEDRPGGFGLESFLDDSTAFFYKGRYFVMVYVTEPDTAILKQWASRVSMGILNHSFPPREIGFFPPNGLKPGSIQYLQEGLLGYRFLKRGFMGTYIEEDVSAEEKAKVKAEVEPRLVLAIFKNSQEAMNALEAYQNHLSQKGKIHPERSTQLGLNAIKGEDPYHGKVILLKKGFYLLGALGFSRETGVKTLLKEFMEKVQ